LIYTTTAGLLDLSTSGSVQLRPNFKESAKVTFIAAALLCPKALLMLSKSTDKAKEKANGVDKEEPLVVAT
jgi:hypothetical protein